MTIGMTSVVLGRGATVFDYDNSLMPSIGGAGLAVFGIERFPTDPIGTFLLVLTNVVIGSRVHVEDQSTGSALHDSVAESSSVSISLPVYSDGSAANDLRVKVRKGTGTPTYKPFETLVTAAVGDQYIYIGQIADE